MENRTCDSEYISALTLEKATTSRRFDTIFECCTFREEPIRSSLLSNAQHRWFMVIDFVNAVRQHRRPFFNPRLDVGGRVHCEVVRRRRSLDRYRIPSICFIGEKTCGWLRDTKWRIRKSDVMIQLWLTVVEVRQEQEFEAEANNGTAVLGRST